MGTRHFCDICGKVGMHVNSITIWERMNDKDIDLCKKCWKRCMEFIKRKL